MGIIVVQRFSKVGDWQWKGVTLNDRFEDLVVNQTMQLVRDDAAMESIIAKVMELQDRENTNLPLYEKQLRDAESGIQNMLNAILPRKSW